MRKYRLVGVCILLAMLLGLFSVVVWTPGRERPIGKDFGFQQNKHRLESSGVEAVASPGAKHVAAPSTLDISATLGLVFVQFRHEAGWNYYGRTDKGAKPYVWKIIREPELKEHRSRAIRALGYIGNGEDARLLEASLHADYFGVLDPHAANSVIAIFHALGIMSRRGVEEAGDILDRMTTFAYWKDARFKWFPDILPARPPFEDTTIEWVMLGYALSENENIEQKSKALVAQVSDPERRKNIAAYTSPKRMRDYAKEVRAAEERPISKDLVAQLSGYFNGNLDQPGPAIPPRPESPKRSAKPATETIELRIETQDDLEEEFVAQMIDQAQVEYGKIFQKAVEGEDILLQLLDDGDPIAREDKREIERLRRAELPKAMEQMEELLQALQTLEAEEGDFAVQRETQVSSSGEVVSETILVTFELVGTRELRDRTITKKYGGSRRTISKRGNLLVVMKRIDGKWYWNPFGW